MTQIYVGNLPAAFTASQLRQVFEMFGKVDSVSVPVDRRTGRMRGFALVEMSAAAALNAIRDIHAARFYGATLEVYESGQSKAAGRQR